MPETAFPKESLWIPFLQDIIGNPDEETLLIGHSIGSVAILRYLETLQDHEAIGAVILVAGFSDTLGLSEIANFFEKPLNFAKMKEHCKKFFTIFSENDPFVPVHHAQIFEKELGATTEVLSGRGHFSGPIDKEESCVMIPELLPLVDTLDL